MRAKVLRVFLSLPADFGNDDLICTLCLERQHNGDAYWSTSYDQDSVTLLKGTDFDSMPSHRERFHQSWNL